ncbi:type III-A CRISPR-associated RAMP protein Csm4 [Helicobacter cetorum]|uniref:CRISPR system Cms protein Csm4 n=1 Tax=Helicobacter cetorum (strain ATCC BAA-429 / MIT 00-7128) TaxID=182217 RepID=I0EP18_HELC0|nr:crispr-associated protein, csm4 family [Helicobacter cetorum]AFI04687.1 crispr-associated protein, csm4 family [Helicobacter cetorum MIT 00-7128]
MLELFAYEITPLSSFATSPKGDTLFGQILSYLYLEDKHFFKSYFGDYCGENKKPPKLIVSDMMPLGYVYKPSLPFYCFDENDKKEFKKKEFILLKHLQRGELDGIKEIKYKTEPVIKNQINRLTFSTQERFDPYSSIEITYTTKLWLFVLVEVSIKEKIEKILEKIGEYGFGKGSSTGKGRFKLGMCCPIPINKKRNTEDKQLFYMSLSPTILIDDNIQNAWYEPFTRFGKFGLENAHDNFMKKPVLMADSGAVIQTKEPLKELYYFGTCLDNGYENKHSFLQGYSIAVPFILENEACLKG